MPPPVVAAEVEGRPDEDEPPDDELLPDEPDDEPEDELPDEPDDVPDDEPDDEPPEYLPDDELPDELPPDDEPEDEDVLPPPVASHDGAAVALGAGDAVSAAGVGDMTGIVGNGV